MNRKDRDQLQHAILNSTAKIAHELNEIEAAAKACESDGNEIRIKSPAIMAEITAIPWHDRLREVFDWLCGQCPGEVVITSGWRPDGSTHSKKPLCVLDLRSRSFTQPKNVAWVINDTWDYGDGKHNVCVYHRQGKCNKCGHKMDLDIDLGVREQTVCGECGAGHAQIRDMGPHFHIQTRAETKKKDI